MHTSYTHEHIATRTHRDCAFIRPLLHIHIRTHGPTHVSSGRYTLRDVSDVCPSLLVMIGDVIRRAPDSHWSRRSNVLGSSGNSMTKGRMMGWPVEYASWARL